MLLVGSWVFLKKSVIFYEWMPLLFLWMHENYVSCIKFHEKYFERNVLDMAELLDEYLVMLLCDFM